MYCSNAAFGKLHFNVKSWRDFWIQLRLLWKSSDPDPREKVRIRIRGKKFGSRYDGKSSDPDTMEKVLIRIQEKKKLWSESKKNYQIKYWEVAAGCFGAKLLEICQLWIKFPQKSWSFGLFWWPQTAPPLEEKVKPCIRSYMIIK